MPTQSMPPGHYTGRGGIQTVSMRSDYKAYKSPYGPQYKISSNYHGINMTRAVRFSLLAGGFGAVAGTFALFFFAEIPRVRKDIMQKVPILGNYFVVEIPPDENPF